MGRKYARSLNRYYQYNREEETLLFEDGVTYSLREAVWLSRRILNEKDIEAVHQVKRRFNGVLEDWNGDLLLPRSHGDRTVLETQKKLPDDPCVSNMPDMVEQK